MSTALCSRSSPRFRPRASCNTTAKSHTDASALKLPAVTATETASTVVRCVITAAGKPCESTKATAMATMRLMNQDYSRAVTSRRRESILVCHVGNLSGISITDCNQARQIEPQQLQPAPTAAQRLDQRYGRDLPVGPRLHQRTPRILGTGLRGDDLGIAHQPGLIPIEHLLLHQVGGFRRLQPQRQLLLQDAGGDQLVLHVLEGRQHGLAIARRGFLEPGTRTLDPGPPRTRVEDRLRQRGTQ